MVIQFLEWDSSFFNKKIGEIELEEKKPFLMDTTDFDLLYVKQNEEEFLEIDHFKQTYFETKVVFAKSISKSDTPRDESIISAFDSTVGKPQIYELAFESGKFSRFNLDEKFKRSEFEALYEKWVDNSLSKEFADGILLYKQQQSILGFITYKVYGDYAKIGLLATKKESQGRGIGSKLVAATENELYEKGVKELRIPTQMQNKQAYSFYVKMGYTIIERQIIKHFWRL